MNCKKESECLFFARDPLGRRSLLIHRPTPDQPYLLLSSVSAGLNAGYNFDDVSTDFIYCLSLRSLASIQDVSPLPNLFHSGYKMYCQTSMTRTDRKSVV